MLNIADCLVEIKREKIPTERPMTFSMMTTSAFITRYDYYDDDNYKTVATNVTNSIFGSEYRFNAGITLIYLYDVRFDFDSAEYISQYGGNMHKMSGTDFTVLTYFTRQMVDNWNRVRDREKIRASDGNDKIRVDGITQKLQKDFGVKNIPAAVVVYNDGSGELKHFGLELDKSRPLYDFRRIFDYIEGNNIEIHWDDAEVEIRKIISPFSSPEFLKNLWKKRGYTQLKLATKIDMDEKTFRNKMTERRFSVEECKKIGLELDIAPADLNKLLRGNGRPDMTPDDEIQYKSDLRKKIR